MASLDALDQHGIDINEYIEQILQQSRHAVLLYTGNSEVEVDRVAAQFQNVLANSKLYCFQLFLTIWHGTRAASSLG